MHSVLQFPLFHLCLSCFGHPLKQTLFHQTLDWLMARLFKSRTQAGNPYSISVKKGKLPSAMSVMFSFLKSRMLRTFILLATLSILTRAGAVTKVSVSCPGHQKPYGGSCYEVVGLRHTFPGAQAWCEQRGGRLACIPDQETQHFLQRHLDPNEDFWFSAASCAAQGSPREGERFKQALSFALHLQNMIHFDFLVMQV